MPQVAVLNRSTVVTDDQVKAIVEAAQQSHHEHFRPVWGTVTTLHFVPTGDTETWKGAYNLVVLDTSDEANALGYHDLTPEGLPLGKAFAKTDQMDGAQLSVTLTHELWEMLVDPYINLTVEDDSRGYFVAYESADAVEADNLAHDVNGIKISNFVTPNYFVRVGPGPYDFGGVLNAPFSLAPGGYEAYWSPAKGWQQNVKRDGGAKATDRPRVGSRRERRRTPLNQWQLSAA
jgi:hypothetical protein